MSKPTLKDLSRTKPLTDTDAEQVKGGSGIIIYKGSTNKG